MCWYLYERTCCSLRCGGTCMRGCFRIRNTGQGYGSRSGSGSRSFPFLKKMLSELKFSLQKKLELRIHGSGSDQNVPDQTLSKLSLLNFFAALLKLSPFNAEFSHFPVTVSNYLCSMKSTLIFLLRYQNYQFSMKIALIFLLRIQV